MIGSISFDDATVQERLNQYPLLIESFPPRPPCFDPLKELPTEKSSHFEVANWFYWNGAPEIVARIIISEIVSGRCFWTMKDKDWIHICKINGSKDMTRELLFWIRSYVGRGKERKDVMEKFNPFKRKRV